MFFKYLLSGCKGTKNLLVIAFLRQKSGAGKTCSAYIKVNGIVYFT